jgi:hypothetical protein
MSRVSPIAEGEPRGAPYGEPRPDDHLYFNEEGEYWVRGKGYETETDLKQPAVGERVCGSKLSGRWHDTWRRCASTGIKKNGKCYLHGGASLEGTAHPNFETGLYSKALDGKMLSEFSRYREHQETLHLRDEITLLTVHISEQVQQMSEAGGFNVLGQIEDQWREVQEALRNGTTAELNATLEVLGELIEQGGERVEELTELQELIDTKRRLVKDEAKRVKDSQEMLRQSEIDVLRMSMINHARTVFEKHDVPRAAQQEFAERLVKQLAEADQQRLDAG